MEIKKSKKADLERRRPWFFLMGALAAAAMMFVILEINTPESDDANLDDLESLIDKDKEDFIPFFKREDIQPVVVQQKAKPKIEKVVEAEEATEEQPTELAPTEETEGTEEEIEEPMEEVPEEATKPKPIAQPDNPLNFQVVEQLPEYPGGMTAFMKWLTKNLKYPRDAQLKKIEGQVTVQFFVEPDGTIANASVIKKLHPSCDREVLRVMRMMPKWKPGTERDKPVRAKIVIPVVFKL